MGRDEEGGALLRDGAVEDLVAAVGVRGRHAGSRGAAVLPKTRNLLGT